MRQKVILETTCLLWQILKFTNTWHITCAVNILNQSKLLRFSTLKFRKNDKTEIDTWYQFIQNFISSFSKHLYSVQNCKLRSAKCYKFVKIVVIWIYRYFFPCKYGKLIFFHTFSVPLQTKLNFLSNFSNGQLFRVK